MDSLNPEIKKPNNKEIAVGIDLTDTFSQLSYGPADSEGVETLSMIAGGSSFQIPTVLYRRKEVNQWYAGAEAMKNAGSDGYLVDRLLSRAASEEDIVVGTEHYRPSALIALFLKRTLSLLNVIEPISRVTSLMVTVDALDNHMASILTEAVASLGLKTDNVFFQSHMESFYYYTIYQPAELWTNNVLLLDFTDEYVKSLRLECNKNTTPIVAFIDPNSHTSLKVSDIAECVPDTNEASAADSQLCNIVKELSNDRVISSVYFIGESFHQDVFKETVRLLCQKGRVFEGNNLYSKGACYAAKNKIYKTILSESHVFLGNDKLKANVGINVLMRGEKAYLPLLSAGVNWFDARRECEIILNQGNRISLVITPMTGKIPAVVDITLGDLPKRPPKTTRLHIAVKMQSENKMEVLVKDLGFGELFAPCGVEWKEVVSI